MIQVKNLTKCYGARVAVNNISFHVHEGEIVGFLGPNGAGKTTTLRILTCFIPATSGSARVAGFDVFAESMKVREHIGYMPESVPLYPEMRVREYLDFRAKLRGIAKADRAKTIARAAERCRLTEFIDRPIGQLSKGMKQRVGLAEAVMHEPKVLILDEPTIGLDPTQIRETRALIKELGERHTIILSSHILPEVEAVCGRTIIIANGQIVASGSPAELRERIAGSSRLIVEVQGPRDAVTNAVQAVSGVNRVETAPVDGWLRLTIEVAEGQDPRQQIVQSITSKHWPLREIRRETGSLEEFFVQITAKQHIQQQQQNL